MKLYWSSRSPYVRKVLVCACELGIADRIERVPAAVSLSQATVR
jgi:glutathione S-transferase